MNATGLIAAAAAVALAAILGALSFEHFGGYAPCKLCLEERIPYYVGLVALAAAAMASRSSKAWPFALCLVISLVFAKGTYLGVYHAGAEWGWWEGPSDCAAAGLSGHYDAAALLDRIRQTKLVSCTEPALTILGLSLAGWNAMASALAAALSAAAAAAWFPGLVAERTQETSSKD